MKILYGICSLGLGHATRSLPLIRHLLKEGNEVTVLSYGIALRLLQMELKDQADFIEVADYPIPYASKPHQFATLFAIKTPAILSSLFAEHRELRRILQHTHYDRIVSDNRYGLYDRNIPSFYIGHQLRLIAPRRMRLIERGSELFTRYFEKYFERFLVPDYPTDDLSGDLSHELNYISPKKVDYIGILSEHRRLDVSEDVDILFSISGPEPTRTLFERDVLAQVNNLSGRIVVSLGNPDVSPQRESSKFREGISIVTYTNQAERESLLNRSRLIVSRSGYSTLMDLYALGKPALFVPTPGQTEQEYLADYHMRKGTFYSTSQTHLDLQRALEESTRFGGPDRGCDTQETLERFMSCLA